MRIYENGAARNLSKRNFVASGGEGSIYVVGSTAYKIYTDPKKVIPLGKIQELAVLTDPHVIKPKHGVTDKAGTSVGYSMSAVPDAHALCQLFPRVFRDRNHVTHQMTLDLISGLQKSVQHVHDRGILVVDLNEMNFLVDKKFKEIFLIDVDSYQTPHYKATALMESVRDRQVRNNIFTTGSDWFSFAVVSFQMFVGIHPFKGKHPTVKGMIKRMDAGISVFDSKVRLPRVCYDLKTIPQSYLDWYRAVFADGKRVPPPGGAQAVITLVPVIKTIAGARNLLITELYEYDGQILDLWEQHGHLLSVTQNGSWYDGYRLGDSHKVKALGFSPRTNQPVALTDTGDLISLRSKAQILFGLNVDNAMSYGGRIYVKNGDKVLEVLLNEMGAKLVATTRLAANVLPAATKMFPGVVVQDLLGSTYVSVFPQSTLTHQTHVKELDPYRVVEARYDSGVLVVIGQKKGRFDRLIFRFDDRHTFYDLRVVKGITYSGINFVVLDSGVAVLFNEDDKLELFSKRKGSKGVKLVEDKVLGGDITLAKLGGQLLFARGNKVYKVKMK